MRSTLRTVIIITTLITALVHLAVLNYLIYTSEGHLDLLFSLNGLGYLTLLGMFVAAPAFIDEQWDFFHYMYMGFAAVTIAAFFVLGGTGFGGTEVDPLGYFTKAVELILIIALWQHRKFDPGLRQTAGPM
jgi:hypothetical protein